MRVFTTLLVFLVTLLAVGAPVVFGVFFLAGPHSKVLPQPWPVIVALFGWVLVITLPILAARAVWRRLPAPANQTPQ